VHVSKVTRTFDYAFPASVVEPRFGFGYYQQGIRLAEEQTVSNEEVLTVAQKCMEMY
jgi:hypothetical protein